MSTPTDIKYFMNSEDDCSTCSSPYWKYFDSTVLMAKQEIMKESAFLGETYYSTKNFKIVVGISIASGLIPSLKVTSTILNLPVEQVTISFSYIEWAEFLDIVTSFMNLYEDNSDVITTGSLSENFTVSTVMFFGERTIKLTRGEVNLCFCIDDIKSILRIRDIIDYRLSLLTELDFRSFYDNSLKYYNVKTVNENNCLSVIKEYCNLNICELSYFMLEFIYLNPEKVIRDFNKLCFVDSDVTY